MTFIPDKLHLVRALIMLLLLRFFTIPTDFNGVILLRMSLFEFVRRVSLNMSSLHVFGLS